MFVLEVVIRAAQVGYTLPACIPYSLLPTPTALPELLLSSK